MKKLFISADLEGVSGVSSWEETRFGGQGYDAACRQLTREVAAACHAAQELGYTVLVKDGHEDARNIDPTGLPRGVSCYLVRSNTTRPPVMVRTGDTLRIFIGSMVKISWSSTVRSA